MFKKTKTKGKVYMKTLEQLKEDLVRIAEEKKDLELKEIEVNHKRKIISGLADVVNTARYRFKYYEGDSDFSELYETAKALIPEDRISELAKKLSEEIDNLHLPQDLGDREYTLKINIQLLEKYGFKSDELLLIKESLKNLEGYNYTGYYRLSNYKKTTLFNSNLLENSVFVVKREEGLRKAMVLVESGFYDKKLYVNILRMSTKMRSTYIITDDSDEVLVEIASYDSKTETYQKLGTLPSVKKEGFIDLLKSECKNEI